MLNNVKIACDWGAPENETFPDFDGWMVKLKYQGRQLTIPFYQGLGFNGAEPKLNTVLESLFSDASAADQARDCEDFARELGYDPDSRKNEKLYKQCLKISKDLHRLLGDDYTHIENELRGDSE